MSTEEIKAAHSSLIPGAFAGHSPKPDPKHVATRSSKRSKKTKYHNQTDKGHCQEPNPIVEKLKPLTKVEYTEYKSLLDQWISNAKVGAQTLTPEQIARFSDLSDRSLAQKPRRRRG